MARQHHPSNLNKTSARHLDREALSDLIKHRSDIFPKMSGMLKRNATIEISHTACHLCGRRFAMRCEVEAKGRTEQASVFLFNMVCEHCRWDAAFYGYIHKNGHYGLDSKHVSADQFFAAHPSTIGTSHV